MFQFHIGSIKNCELPSPEFMMPRFNSTLVQLKNGKFLSVILVNPLFQFHIGSIKKENVAYIKESEKGVSIPHWFN